ncbi:hydrolase [Halobacillus andaensis]|uniref:Hydrolase n=1 Tax=Halobacillus andaensis TaxID=1176239 RepID=A0A917ET05_HALAA|nr:MBL fold metallo-hydrolase [Halobacillus andaensis]MBP2003192.1 glyoxylase-like metal-dependent hydrolase (beta-lactamase superfamily II) [Halobacillus andaensis]GGF08693.1 hydrolase [Halobacillus andaensis]
MRTIKDTIHQITMPTPYAVGDVHAYLLEGDMLTLIDAGVKTEEAWQAMKGELKKLDVTPNDIEQIVLTHHHPDHMGLVENFPHLKSVAGHPLVRPWYEQDEAFFIRYEDFFQQMYTESGVPEEFFYLLKNLRKPLKWTSSGKLKEELVEGDVLTGHPEWKVIETPGHAQSHISLYRESDQSLIGGDHLLAHISSNPLLEPPKAASKPRPRPLLQYRDSMKKLLHYHVDTVYPGHGEVFLEMDALITQRLKSQEVRAAKVLSMLQGGEMTAYQVCEKLFPRHLQSQFGLTMSETIGQLDYLEDTNQIRFHFIGEQKFYYVNR